uniref:TNFR-Cys domain-containing protein n=1 Tax=Periophthalmus magnuspinnatus TaxID=409849 RepID=A0A3B4AGV7_9GOBI
LFSHQMSSVHSVAATSRVCPSSVTYTSERSGLCCDRCPPGHKLKEECTETNDSVCEPCGPDQYNENWNFASNCISCVKCKDVKGLQYAQNCSSTKRAKCECKSGRYCAVGNANGQCQECAAYRKCKKGFVTNTSNVTCKKCPEGTFSDTISTEACKPHSICGESHIISKGNATSDTVCKVAASTQPTVMLKTKPESTVMPGIQVTEHKTIPKQISNSPGPSNFSSSTERFSRTISEVPLDTGPDKQLAAGFGSVAGIFLILIVVVLVVFRLLAQGQVSICLSHHLTSLIFFHQTNLCYLDTEHSCFKAVQPEQQCLLENGDANQNHCISNCKSNGQLQSTIPVCQPQSALSEPLPLHSNVDQVFSQIGTSLQSSSQPTSPQSMVPSPLVNVNINLHIGGPPGVMLTDIPPAEPKIPFGEEEESCSLLQQEDGKPSLLSVEESGNLNNMSTKTLDQSV